MPRGQTKRTQQIRNHLLDAVRLGKPDVVSDAVEVFQLSRQSIHRYLAALVKENRLTAIGKTRARRYGLGLDHKPKG